MQNCYSNHVYMYDYFNFTNHYFIIFSLTQSDSIPSFFSLLFLLHLTHSLFTYTANQLSAHHHSTDATHNHHFTTHKKPTTNSIENQSQNQWKIQTHPTEKPKSTKIKTKNQQKSNLKSTPTYQTKNPNPPEALSDLTLTKALVACHYHLCGGFTSSIFSLFDQWVQGF